MRFWTALLCICGTACAGMLTGVIALTAGSGWAFGFGALSTLGIVSLRFAIEDRE